MAPYILERMIEIHKDLQSVEISMELLTSIAKLFFSRAPEVKDMLGRFIKYSIAENNDVDLRDRAAFYYKLLKSDTNLAKRVICSENEEITDFYENSFSTKYLSHDEYFKADVLKIKSKFKAKKKAEDAEGEERKQLPDLVEESKDVDDAEEFNLLEFGEEAKQESPTKAKSKPTKSGINLLENDTTPEEDPLGSLIDNSPTKHNNDLIPMDDDNNGFEDLGGAFSYSGAQTPPQAPKPAAPKLSLKQTSDMDPNAFQQKWMSLPPFPAIQK